MKKLKLFRKPLKEALREELKNPQKTGEIIPLWLFTVGYIGFAVCLILGVQFPTAPNPEPIPPEDLPIAIPALVAIYFLILGIVKLMDYLRKRRRRNLQL